MCIATVHFDVKTSMLKNFAVKVFLVQTVPLILLHPMVQIHAGRVIVKRNNNSHVII